MSESAPGPGWWQASDGNWYPPAPEPPPVHVPLQHAEAVMPIDVGPVPAGDPMPVAPGPAVYPERPPLLPVGVEPPVPVGSADAGRPTGPPVDWPMYDHPVLPDAEAAPDPRNQLIGVFLVAAALVVVGASLLPWVTFDGGPVGGDSSGWFRGEGKITVAAGLILAGAGGAIAAGAQRLWLKVVAMIASVVIIGVFVIDVVDISMEADDLVRQGFPVDLDQGYGLWMVGIAGICAFVLTLVERTPYGSS